MNEWPSFLKKVNLSYANYQIKSLVDGYYSWPLNNTGLNWAGSLKRQFFFFFFFMKYYSTSTICSWLNPLTTEPQIRRADCEVICGFWTAQRPKPLCCWSVSCICISNRQMREDTGLPWWLRWKKICLQCRRPGLDPWVGKSQVGYSPWGSKKLDTTEQLSQMKTFEVLSCSELCPRSCCQREVNTGFKPREFDSNNS